MPVRRARSFLDEYTRDVTGADVQRLFTRDTAEAYRYFVRGIDVERLVTGPWYRRWWLHTKLVFTGFTMRLSPARRVLYGCAVIAAVVGVLMLFRGFASVGLFIFPFRLYLPIPQWVEGTLWLVAAFAAVNLLILMEVADRLSLKGELEIARDIQLAMLPSGLRQAGDADICGLTRPANTVGGDFYDILTLADGRIVLAVGDVAGKGSPAALLMALLLAILRTLVDEGLETSRLVERLNVQVARHSPSSRFITLFFGIYDPVTGGLEYVNAGHLPPLVRRADGRYERVDNVAGGLALGMFASATYQTQSMTMAPGDLLVLYSDGITEAETPSGVAFEETGLQVLIDLNHEQTPEALGRSILAGVEAHAGDARLADDLTVLVLRRQTPVI